MSEKIERASLEALVYAAQFVGRDGEMRRAMLRTHLALTTDLDDLDIAHFDAQTTLVGLDGEIQRKRARLAVIGDPGPATAGDISTAALRAEMEKHERAEQEFASHCRAMASMSEERARLQAQVEVLTAQLQQANEALAAHNTRFFDHASCQPPKPDPNGIAETQKALAAAEKHNEKCRLSREKKKLEAELLALQQQHAQKEQELGQIESEKIALMSLDALVPGLRCTDTEVLLHEKPLSEATLEQQMEVGLAVYEAMQKRAEPMVPEGTA